MEEITRLAIEKQLKEWKTAMEDWRIAAIVSDKIGDGEERKEQLRKEVTRCVKAIEVLEAMICEKPSSQ
jgi:hypothetical protein